MRGFYILKSELLTKLVFAILICFSLTSCLEVKQKINIHKDGSGKVRAEVGIIKKMLYGERLFEALAEFREDIKKEGWKIVGEKEEKGKYVIVFEKKFKDISELNDDESRYTFSSERRGFLRKTYTLEVKHIESSEIPFPYEISIKVPGSIDETNGIKVSTDEAKWNLQGLQRGTVISLKSSGFTIPVFSSLLMMMAGLLLLFVVVLITRKVLKPGIPKSRVSSEVIFCTQCGKKNPATAFFCTNCGKDLSKGGGLYDL